MYALVDQPVDRLCQGSRFVLWAQRSWTQAASDRICPPKALAPAFRRMGVLAALSDFHIAMAFVNADAVAKLSIGPINQNRVGEDEAILLELWSTSLITDCHARRDGTLKLLVAERSVATVSRALGSAAAVFAANGMAPAGLESRNTKEARR